MVPNATFNNISAISWRWVLLVQERYHWTPIYMYICTYLWRRYGKNLTHKKTRLFYTLIIKKKKKKKEYFHISIKGFFKPGVGIMSCPLVSKLFNYILMSLLVPIYEDVTVKSSSCRPMYWTHKITLVNTTLW
jgi:hypothetical protein